VFQGEPFDTQGKSKFLLRHLNTGRLMAFNAENMPVLKDFIENEGSSPEKARKPVDLIFESKEPTVAVAVEKKKIELPFDPASVGGNDEDDDELSDDSLGIEKKPKKRQADSEEGLVESDFGDDDDMLNLAKATLKMDPSIAQKSKQSGTNQEINEKEMFSSGQNLGETVVSPRKGSIQARAANNKVPTIGQVKSNVLLQPVQPTKPVEPNATIPNANSNPVKRIKLVGSKKKDDIPFGGGEYKQNSDRDWDFGNDDDAKKSRIEIRNASPSSKSKGKKDKTESDLSKKSNATSRGEEMKEKGGRIKYPNLNDNGLISDFSEA
jgi:hypothetical protein